MVEFIGTKESLINKIMQAISPNTSNITLYGTVLWMGVCYTIYMLLTVKINGKTIFQAGNWDKPWSDKVFYVYVGQGDVVSVNSVYSTAYFDKYKGI